MSKIFVVRIVLLALGSIALYAMNLLRESAVVFGMAALLAGILLYVKMDREDRSAVGERDNHVRISDRPPALSSWSLTVSAVPMAEREDNKPFTGLAASAGDVMSCITSQDPSTADDHESVQR